MIRLLLLTFLFLFVSCSHIITTEESLKILSRPNGTKELVDALAQENLEKNKVQGIVVGIITPNEGIRYYTYGYRNRNKTKKMTEDTIFQLGSITKVFTSSLLSVLEDEHEMKLKDPIKMYLRPDFKPKTTWVSDITLEQLVSHSSGLTSEYHRFEMIVSAIKFLWSGENIWKDLTQKKLLKYIEEYDFGVQTSRRYKYSNIAYVLMGTIFDLKYPDKKYEGLLKEKINAPLALHDTVFTLNNEQRSRLSSGYSGNAPPLMRRGIQMKPWNFQSGLNAAGGLYSTAPDLMKFLVVNMRGDDRLPGKSFKKTHQYRVKFNEGHIGLGWFIEKLKRSKVQVIYHNGIISGHTSYLGYHEESGIGVVVLQNAMNMNYEFGDKLLDLLVLGRK